MGKILDQYRQARPLRRQIYALAWPAVLEQLLVMLVGIVSTILVGRLSTEAIAAVGLVNMIVAFIQAVFAALSTGVTVLVAREVGAGDGASARCVTLQSAILSVAFAGVITALCFLTMEPTIRLFMGANGQEVLFNASIYYRYILYSFPLLIVSAVLSGALRGAGEMRMPMYIAAVVNVVNALLSLVLIYGFGPVRPMGVAGAGLAVLISRVLGAALIVLALFMTRAPVRLSLADRIRVDLTAMRRIMNIGLPASLEQVVMQGGFLMMQFLIAGMGNAQVATFQVVNSINSLAYMPVFGLSIAATTIVGQALGARELEKAERSVVQMQMIGILGISLFGLGIVAFARPLALLYSTDPAVVAMTAAVLPVMALGEPAIAVLNVMSASLRGAGDTRYILGTSVVGIWGFRILLILLFTRVLSWGIQGVYWATLADYTIRSLMYILRFKRGRWKTILI